MYREWCDEASKAILWQLKIKKIKTRTRYVKAAIIPSEYICTYMYIHVHVFRWPRHDIRSFHTIFFSWKRNSIKHLCQARTCSRVLRKYLYWIYKCFFFFFYFDVLLRTCFQSNFVHDENLLTIGKKIIFEDRCKLEVFNFKMLKRKIKSLCAFSYNNITLYLSVFIIFFVRKINY